jgi:hypothetical protein
MIKRRFTIPCPRSPGLVVKKALNNCGGDPDAGVRHRYKSLTGVGRERLDRRITRPSVTACIASMPFNQIDEHLLQLDPIGEDQG